MVVLKILRFHEYLWYGARGTVLPGKTAGEAPSAFSSRHVSLVGTRAYSKKPRDCITPTVPRNLEDNRTVPLNPPPLFPHENRANKVELLIFLRTDVSCNRAEPDDPQPTFSQKIGTSDPQHHIQLWWVAPHRSVSLTPRVKTLSTPQENPCLVQRGLKNTRTSL